MKVVDDVCTVKSSIASLRAVLAQATGAEAAGPGVARTAYALSHANASRVSSLNEPRTSGYYGIASSARRKASPRLLLLGHM